MSKVLLARVIEGTDVWYDTIMQHLSATHSPSKLSNRDFAIVASCDQQGFNSLYNIGKDLYSSDMCSEFEIAAFDNGSLFWKARPDKWNFEQNKYQDCFDRLIDEELQSFRSEDFQNDKLEMEYITDYQNKFWKNIDVQFSTESFVYLLNDTRLYEDLMMVQQWINSNIGLELEDILHDCGFKYEGQFIINPFYDETLRFEVEPVSYYGKENIKQYISKMKDYLQAQSQQHTPLNQKIAAAEKQTKDINTSQKAIESELDR